MKVSAGASGAMQGQTVGQPLRSSEAAKKKRKGGSNETFSQDNYSKSRFDRNISQL